MIIEFRINGPGDGVFEIYDDATVEEIETALGNIMDGLITCEWRYADDPQFDENGFENWNYLW